MGCKCDNDNIKDLIEHLKRKAERECETDGPDFNPYEASGGNYDDAYWMGVSDGETMVARMVLGVLVDGYELP